MTGDWLIPAALSADQPTVNPLSQTRHKHRPSTLSLAYVAATFPLRSETFVYREVRALRERGHDVTCVTLHPSDAKPASADDLTEALITAYDNLLIPKRLAAEVRQSPVRVVKTLFGALRDAIAPGESTGIKERMQLPFQAIVAIAMAGELRQNKVQHIHAHFAHSPTTLAMYAAAYLDIPFSFTGHANDIFQRRALLRLKLDRAKFVSSISEWHQDFYRSESDAGTDRLPVIRCGVDTNVWNPEHPNHDSDDPLHIVTVCRLVDKKGIDVLIKAMAEMTEPARLTIGGDGPERERLGTLAHRLECEDRITWLGAIENDAVRKLMATADVFALPCQTDMNGDRDGIPVVLMEAMASGVPVASGDLPAIRELIHDGYSGWLLDASDTAAWSALFDRLSTSDLASVVAEARGRIEQEFALSLTVDRLESHFGIEPRAVASAGFDERSAA